ncbi:hypothetical protein AMTR_s00106p00152940 [Amborella trichopoda]|uniref:Uncharacterized protein n=1 Tax=Amborella trichopoda TaxID=13333 RepID=W1NZP7_AMBTC|nr:hypothetical protein AMTR_s00106p00152940 [Amborella trichopoda]
MSSPMNRRKAMHISAAPRIGFNIIDLELELELELGAVIRQLVFELAFVGEDSRGPINVVPAGEPERLNRHRHHQSQAPDVPEFFSAHGASVVQSSFTCRAECVTLATLMNRWIHKIVKNRAFQERVQACVKR